MNDIRYALAQPMWIQLFLWARFAGNRRGGAAVRRGDGDFPL